MYVIGVPSEFPKIDDASAASVEVKTPPNSFPILKDSAAFGMITVFKVNVKSRLVDFIEKKMKKKKIKKVAELFQKSNIYKIKPD